MSYDEKILREFIKDNIISEKLTTDVGKGDTSIEKQTGKLPTYASERGSTYSKPTDAASTWAWLLGLPKETVDAFRSGKKVLTTIFSKTPRSAGAFASPYSSRSAGVPGLGGIGTGTSSAIQGIRNFFGGTIASAAAISHEEPERETEDMPAHAEPETEEPEEDVETPVDDSDRSSGWLGRRVRGSPTTESNKRLIRLILEASNDNVISAFKNDLASLDSAVSDLRSSGDIITAVSKLNRLTGLSNGIDSETILKSISEMEKDDTYKSLKYFKQELVPNIFSEIVNELINLLENPKNTPFKNISDNIRSEMIAMSKNFLGKL